MEILMGLLIAAFGSLSVFGIVSKNKWVILSGYAPFLSGIGLAIYAAFLAAAK